MVTDHTALNYFYSPNGRPNSGRVKVRLAGMREVLLPDIMGGVESRMGLRQSLVANPRASSHNNQSQFDFITRP